MFVVTARGILETRPRQTIVVFMLDTSVFCLLVERSLTLVQIGLLLWAYKTRPASLEASDRPLRDCIAGVLGTFVLGLMDFGSRSDTGMHLAPALQPLNTASIALRVASVLSLGRSFGVRAANRGVVTSGTYAYVRHPIYAAYMASATVQLCLHATARNVLVVACWSGLHVWRIRCEEELLMRSAAYRAYVKRVRWRVVPGVH